MWVRLDLQILIQWQCQYSSSINSWKENTVSHEEKRSYLPLVDTIYIGMWRNEEVSPVDVCRWCDDGPCSRNTVSHEEKRSKLSLVDTMYSGMCRNEEVVPVDVCRWCDDGPCSHRWCLVKCSGVFLNRWCSQLWWWHDMSGERNRMRKSPDYNELS